MLRVQIGPKQRLFDDNLKTGKIIFNGVRRVLLSVYLYCLLHVQLSISKLKEKLFQLSPTIELVLGLDYADAN